MQIHLEQHSLLYETYMLLDVELPVFPGAVATHAFLQPLPAEHDKLYSHADQYKWLTLVTPEEARICSMYGGGTLSMLLHSVPNISWNCV